MISGGRLCLSVSYGRKIHRRETVEVLAERMMSNLRELIVHCQSEGAGGYTPSDFPLSRLTQEELDRVVEEQDKKRVEDIYVLSPMQEGILFHTLYEPGTGMYSVQLSCVLKGKVEVGKFRQAWEMLVERHAMLRTSFVWKGLGRAHQLVHSEAPLRWVVEDWRGFLVAEQEERLGQYLAEDRKRGFEFEQAPLMRLGLYQTAEDAWQFTWSGHHILMDGWCTSLMFGEVLESYQELSVGVLGKKSSARPYRDYIRWLQQQEQYDESSKLQNPLRPQLLFRGKLEIPVRMTELGITVQQCHGIQRDQLAVALARDNRIHFEILRIFVVETGKHLLGEVGHLLGKRTGKSCIFGEFFKLIWEGFARYQDTTASHAPNWTPLRYRRNWRQDLGTFTSGLHCAIVFFFVGDHF